MTSVPLFFSDCLTKETTMDIKNKDTDKPLNILKEDTPEKKMKDASQEETDKYLAIEQPGISYSKDTNPTSNSDTLDYIGNSENEEWSEEGGNSRNSDAFNQDDNLLEDNIDLDEDQNQSISSDDDDFEESNERYTN